MSRETTEELVKELAREFEPAPPIPSLRAVFGSVVLVWALAFAGMLAFGASAREPQALLPHGDPASLLILVGLGVFAAGATLRSLASAVPGREASSRSGARLALVGAALVVVGGVCALALAAPEPAGLDVPAAFACTRHAVLLGLLPLIVASVFLARAFANTPVVAALFVATGAIAFGAVAVHLVCRISSPLHSVLGHALAPLLLGCVFAVPIGLALRAWRDR